MESRFVRTRSISSTIGRPSTAANGQPTSALTAVQNIDKNLNSVK